MRWTYPIAALALCLSAAQEDPPGWQTSQQAEVLRLMQAGQVAQMQKVVPELLAKANAASSGVGYRAALHQLWGAAANQLGQYREAEAKLAGDCDSFVGGEAADAAEEGGEVFTVYVFHG